MNDMREKFEAWIASQCRKNGASNDYITSILRRSSDGFYTYAGLETRFSDFCEVWELSAASQAQQPVVPHDFYTHKQAWRNALVIAEAHAKVHAPDVDDKSYWRHELRAFDRAFEALPPAPEGGE